MKCILVDRETAKELLDAYGHEFSHGRRKRIVKLLQLAHDLVAGDDLERRPDHFGRGSGDGGDDTLASLRIVSIPEYQERVSDDVESHDTHMRLHLELEKGGHDASEATKSDRSSEG
jgi:hypothetical protein